jgi:hypothetical protein
MMEGHPLKKFAVCLTISWLVLVAGHPISSFAQAPDPPTTKETSWWVLIFSFDSSGQYVGRSSDRFTFSKGYFSDKYGEEGRYTESYGIVLPDLSYTIWDSAIWLDFGGQLQYMGIRCSKYPNMIIGRIVNSANPASYVFLGFKIRFPKEL